MKVVADAFSGNVEHAPSGRAVATAAANMSFLPVKATELVISHLLI
jgi:hypothetical protein